ncbi:hypothetical protein COCOBI_13-1440 [Coccomyxa sp. Obi]|nr:hypothetical protein COCOBI_13-1440 [Coccomyxa sp. Obi]
MTQAQVFTENSEVTAHNLQLLDGNTPGKVGGPPGDAFDLVYTVVADAVREKMHNVDPVLTEYIRRHLYGDIYSSPGLTLAQKQILMVAFLGEANMHEQLFGHLLAAMRFGNDLEACLKAIQIGFELSPRPSDTVYQGAVKTLEMAYRKYKKDFKEGPPKVPTVTVPDPETVLIPPLYKPVDQLQEEGAAESLQEEERDAIMAMAIPDTKKQPMLQHAGPSEAFSKLQIERSGPSGNFSKLYNLKVRAFAHDMSHSTADSATP